ncbi:MAG TPA: hypothetical protein VFW94_11780 [Candidatus Acidoferrales bacterium]|nr:hypothetical protein [Candidatus Acidoferrales bacterium]
MHKLWRGIVRTVFWSYERGSWPYDVMVLAILAFVLLTPRNWFHDQPPANSRQQNSVRLISQGPDKMRVYRIDAVLLDPQNNATKEKPELETRARDVLRRNVGDLSNQTFEVAQIVAVRASDGSVRSYDVTVRR